MQINDQKTQQITFSVYPHFLFFLLQLCVLSFIAYLFLISGLILKVVEVILFTICFVELFFQYMTPMRVKIDKSTQMIWCRDISLIPTFFVKDDTKDELASSNPNKHFSIKDLKSFTFSQDMPELTTKMLGLFPTNKHVGGRFSLIYSDGERIDLYVSVVDLYRHKKAFVKTAQFLGIPFEVNK